MITYSVYQISRLLRQFYVVGTKNHLVIFLLVSFLLGGITSGVSQNSAIDNLKSAASISPEAGKSKIYLAIAKKYRHINYDSVVIYGNKALDQSLLLEDNNMLIESLMELAYINVSVGNNKRSNMLYDQAKQLCIKENNNYLLAKIYIDLGRYYGSSSNYAGILSSLDTALSIIIDYNFTSLKPPVYTKISYLYLLINDLSNAAYYSKLSMASSALDRENTYYIENLLLIGKIFLEENNYDSTSYYFNTALNSAKETNNKVLMQQAYRKISHYHMDKKNYEKSIIYTDSSITLCKEIPLPNEFAALITYKAHISSIKGNDRRALEYNLYALELRQKTGHKSSICASLLNIGGNYTKLGEYEKAQDYLQRGLEISESQNILSYSAYAYDKLAELFSKKGNFKEALQFTELKTKYNDSIKANKTNGKVMFFRSQFELEKEKTILERIKLKKKTNEIIFLIVIIVVSLGGVIILGRLNYLRKISIKEIEKLSRIIETTTQAVFVTNSKCEILYVNTGLLNIIGFSSKKDLIGRSMFDITDEKGKELFDNEILPALLTVGHWNGELTNVKNDGSFFPSEEIFSVINDQFGNPEFYVSIFNDITKRKQDEFALKSSREKLERTINTQDKMFSIIAHDLTGSFSSILGLSELMATRFNTFQKNEHIKFSQLIYKSSKNTFDLLTNLLQWSRSQQGSIELKKVNINLYDLVSENVEPLQLMINKKGISFYNKVNSKISAYVDYNTISVVIRNLISNGVKFTPRGGSLIVTAVQTNKNIKLIFSDTGIGIEDISNLFDINNNNSKRGTEDERGTGLGLVLCKEFTELNNGTISVESEFGNGSKFTLCFPFEELPSNES